MKNPSSSLAIIQARMSSTRFPGKALEAIDDRPMLWHVVERVRKAKGVDEVLVATTDSEVDDPIARFCEIEKIPFYRGSEADVLDRFYQAARSRSAETIIRVTADCPLIDPEIISEAVSHFQKSATDYTYNFDKYPDGMDTEVFSFRALEKAWQEATKPSEREHVTPYLRNSGKFQISSVTAATVKAPLNVHWSVDHPEDLEFVRKVYAALSGKPTFGLRDLLTVLETERGEKISVPKAVPNAGYYKSLYDQADSSPTPPLSLTVSQDYFAKASKIIPAQAQTFSKSYLQFVQGVSPIFLQRGKGAMAWDVDGNEYIDYVQGLLANVLGYAHPEVTRAVSEQLEDGLSFSLPHPIELKLAEKLIEIIPCAEAVRFGKNGSDATAGAVRAARAYTGRDRVAVCGYHGWQDWYIGSTTRHRGVPEAIRELTQTFIYNDLDSVAKLFDKYPKQFAAVILEPTNFIEPKPGFLEGLKTLCEEAGTLLIFDEICSGVHLGLGGAQKKYGVTPDMACFGKALGGGFPISCIVGRRDVMEIFNEIFFSFTLGGEAASMAAALKVIEVLETTDALEQMAHHGQVLQNGFNSLAKEAGLSNHFECIGQPRWSLMKFRDENRQDSLITRSLFQQECVKQGLLFLVTHNLSAAHNALTTERTLEVYAKTFKILKQWFADGVLAAAKHLQGKPIQPIFRVR